ncbi:TraH family protein [Xanthobacter sp. VNH20]|uniref:TraH family protein n=1 Tax=Xanthobacter sp. VNH20 TaxID=3156616 RepID=UPI0032B44C52
MFDAALVKQCADPMMKPAIVEKFISAVGQDNPLAISVSSGKRVILVPPAASPDEAVGIIRNYLGHAVVRVGITQFPAGVGAADPSDITADIVDPCTNLRLGTQLFGKVYRIVVKWYGTPREEAFTDAIAVWKSGYFEGDYVFSQLDPGSLKASAERDEHTSDDTSGAQSPDEAKSQPSPPSENGGDDPNKAGIRIDLSGLSARTKE